MNKKYVLGLVLLLMLPFALANTKINNTAIHNEDLNLTINITGPDYTYYDTLTNETGYTYLENVTPVNQSITLTFNITQRNRTYEETTNNTASLEQIFFYADDSKEDLIRYRHDTSNKRIDIVFNNLTSVRLDGLTALKGNLNVYEIWKGGSLIEENQNADSYTLDSSGAWSLFATTHVYTGALGHTERLLVIVLVVLIAVGIVGIISKNPYMIVAGIIGLVFAIILVGSIL